MIKLVHFETSDSMSFTIDDYDLRQSFTVERKLFLFAGLYPKKDKNYSKLYFFSAFVNQLISYSQLLTMIVQMVLDRSNLPQLIGTLLYFVTHFTFLCKLLNFQSHAKDLTELEDFLTEPVFYGFSFDHLQVVKDKIRSCDFIANAYRFCVCCTLTFYCSAPFIDVNRRGELPLPGWIPWDTRTYYVSTYVYQVASIIISAYCNTLIDILTWKLLTLASAQFEILKMNLTSIDFANSDSSTKEILVKYINHHRKIVELTKRTQAIFSKGMFLQLFCSCLVICTTGFQMMLVPIPSIQFAFGVSYLCGMTCQIATYCWYGHNVMTTSDEIGQSVYMTNWYMSDVKIRKILLTFGENIKKPTLVKAGNFVTLSLATFTQIMRSAYSYFAVLQRLYAKDN